MNQNQIKFSYIPPFQLSFLKSLVAKYLLGLILMSGLFSCNRTNKQLFDNFHRIYEKKDFKAMNALLTDDFVAFNKNGEITFTKPSYIDYMAQWNRAFETKWHVESVTEIANQIKSIEYDTDIYNDYFNGGKKRTIYIYTFSDNKIKSIQTILTLEGKKCEQVAQARFAMFYDWVKTNYPDKLQYCTSYDWQSAIEVKSLLQNYLQLINGK